VKDIELARQMSKRICANIDKFFSKHISSKEADEELMHILTTALAKVRAETLEEAARVAEDAHIDVTFALDGTHQYWLNGKEIAKAIRALGEGK
jgi:hypothetical protein